MRKIIALILTLSIFSAAAAVPVTVSADTALSGALEKYADTLNSYLKKNNSIKNSNEKYKFALAYIDGDNIPELIVSTHPDAGFGNVYFYFASGSALKSGSVAVKYTGTGIEFAAKQSNIYVRYSSTSGSMINDFYQWTGSAIEKIKSFTEVTGVTPYWYSINEEEVSEAYYKSQFNSLKNKYTWSEYSFANAFGISSSSISGMKQNYQKYVVGATGGSGIKVVLNGSEMFFDVDPYIEDGVTMVPMRAIFEALGATVEYNSSSKTIKAVKGSKEIGLTLGSSAAYVNGVETTMQSPAVLSNGYTMVPLRFVSENLDASVTWNGDTKTVVITSN